MGRSRGPRWWLLYALLPLLVGLFAIEAGLVIPEGWRQVIDVAIVIVVFGLAYRWVTRNSVRLGNLGNDVRGIMHLPAPGQPANGITPRNGVPDQDDYAV